MSNLKSFRAKRMLKLVFQPDEGCVSPKQRKDCAGTPNNNCHLQTENDTLPIQEEIEELIQLEDLFEDVDKENDPECVEFSKKSNCDDNNERHPLETLIGEKFINELTVPELFEEVDKEGDPESVQFSKNSNCDDNNERHPLQTLIGEKSIYELTVPELFEEVDIEDDPKCVQFSKKSNCDDNNERHPLETLGSEKPIYELTVPGFPVLRQMSTNFINVENSERSDECVINNCNENIALNTCNVSDKTPIPSPVPPHDDDCNNPFCSFCVEKLTVLCNADLNENLPTPSSLSVSNTTTPISKQTRKKTYKIDKGKKRLVHKENWEVVQRKQKKNEGKSFTNKNGKIIEEKKLKEPCKTNCRLKCRSYFTHEQRLHIFYKFWCLADRNRQWEFVIKYTNKIPKRRSTTDTIKHDRQNTFIYSLPTEEKQKQKVCKTMFLNTISSGERIVTTAWKKYDGEATVEPDRRGRYNHKPRVIDEDMIKSVCDHVNTLDRVESHYIRKNSKKLYLNDIKSSRHMFRLYNEWFDSDKYKNKALTRRQYREIVNANFNLGYHKPKKDLCDVCHIFENKQFPSEDEKKKYMEHRAKSKVARCLKKSDKLEARSNNRIVAATFDFEKVLLTPHGEVSIFYYKRKLSTFNFTVYDLATKDAICYMWHEGIAKRGANEVSSSLYHFIKENVEKGVKEFRFWSDNCAGQNRNRIVFSLYLLASRQFSITITHRFMEKGHTQNEGDSVHSTIERASDRKLIYTPEQWYCLARWAKVEGEPYSVKEMMTPDFYDFKAILSNKNWTKNTQNEKIQWNQIKEVKVKEYNYDRIEYKYTLEEEPKTIIVLRTGTRNNQRLDKEFEIKQAYDGPIQIPFDKYKDLTHMCQTGVIPQQYHRYYENLPHIKKTSKNTNDENVEDEYLLD